MSAIIPVPPGRRGKSWSTIGRKIMAVKSIRADCARAGERGKVAAATATINAYARIAALNWA